MGKSKHKQTGTPVKRKLLGYMEKRRNTPKQQYLKRTRGDVGKKTKDTEPTPATNTDDQRKMVSKTSLQRSVHASQ